MDTSNRLWTKDFIIISSMNFFLTLVVYLLMVIIGGYAVEHYDATTSQAGLVSGIFIVGVLIGRIFIGRSIEQLGYKNTLFAGIVLYILSTCLYFLDFGIIFLIITRIIHGAMLGIAITADTTIVARIIPESRKGEGISFFSLSTIIATAIGPFFGILLTQHTNFNVIFLICLLLGVLSLIVAFFVKIPKGALSKETAKTSAFQIKNYIEKRAIPISIVILIVGFCYSGVLNYINFYAKEINQVNAASFFFVTYSIAILLSRPFTGRLLDVKGANYIMYPAFVLFVIGMLLLSMANSAWLLLLSSIFIGLGFGNMQSCAQAISIKSVPPERIGLATATFSIFIDIGLGFGPYLLGFLLPIMSYSKLYMILACVIFATTGLYYLLYGKTHTNNYHTRKQTQNV